MFIASPFSSVWLHGKLSIFIYFLLQCWGNGVYFFFKWKMRSFGIPATDTVGVWRERANIMRFEKQNGNTAASKGDIRSILTWKILRSSMLHIASNGQNSFKKKYSYLDHEWTKIIKWNLKKPLYFWGMSNEKCLTTSALWETVHRKDM